MENAQQPPRSPLDQMQFIFTKALECVGSVFQTANQGGNREKAAATALRLKQMIPAANNQFHDALDELEAEIMQARFILKQELSSLRDRQATTTMNGTNGAHHPEPNDVEMPDMPPHSDEPVFSRETDKDSTVNDGHVPPEPLKPEQPKSTPSLQIDTSSKPDAAEAAEITTGGMSAMDFDSLFNDPNSATASITGSPPKAQMTEPAKPESTATPPPPPPAQMQSQDDRAEISSLLPGLESYANAADDTIDLSTPIANKPEPPSTETQSQPQPQTQSQTQDPAPTSNSGGSQPGSQQDTTFDDLMNFADFDLGSFGGGDGDFDGSGTTFDESFFNVE